MQRGRQRLAFSPTDSLLRSGDMNVDCNRPPTCLFPPLRRCFCWRPNQNNYFEYILCPPLNAPTFGLGTFRFRQPASAPSTSPATWVNKLAHSSSQPGLHPLRFSRKPLAFPLFLPGRVRLDYRQPSSRLNGFSGKCEFDLPPPCRDIPATRDPSGRRQLGTVDLPRRQTAILGNGAGRPGPGPPSNLESALEARGGLSFDHGNLNGRKLAHESARFVGPLRLSSRWRRTKNPRTF